MSRTAMKRALGSLRRLIRRRRVPSPSEQEWLRLILLVRRLQHGQLAFVTRLDEIRALTGAVGSFRSDFGALHEQLGAARLSASELERGLSERLQRLDGLPDPTAERADVDQRLATLDGLAARLETLAAEAPTTRDSSEQEVLLARLSDLATRFEAAQQVERAVGGQDELARLYERIQELAEGLARAPRERTPDADDADGPAADLENNVARLGEQLETLDCALESLGTGDSLQVLGETLARLEKLARRFERKGGELRAGALASGELAALLARFENLAERLELAPVSLPELPVGTMTEGGGDEATLREIEGLRAAVLCEQESRRHTDEELQTLRERLRASELARVELETRHATELTQMADHVQRQLQRVEDDLKKKKRGLAELTQQNIALQGQLARLQGSGAPPEPPPALPSSTSFSRRSKAEKPAPEKDKDKDA
jgi:chromosome segregation ATPase